MDPNDLIDRARSHKMTPAEKRAQRISFVFGNTHIHNSAITREMIEKIVSLYEEAASRD